MNLQIMVMKKWMADISYSKNYLIGGTTSFKDSFTGNKQNYFSIRLLYNLKLDLFHNYTLKFVHNAISVRVFPFCFKEIYEMASCKGLE